MTKEQMQVALQQWMAINPKAPRGHKQANLADNGRLIIKYYKTDKKTFDVMGTQFIIELDEGQDLYNVTVEKYRNCDIIARKKVSGLFFDMLDTKTLTYNL